MRQIIGCAVLLCVLLSSYSISQVQQKSLSNEDVIAMVSLGLSDDVVIEKIRSAAATNFDTGLDGIKVLKAAKVSDAVLKAMISPPGSPTGSSSGRVLDEMSTKFQLLCGASLAMAADSSFPRMAWS
ncbi:MAG TPA: hypothetical protein VH308_02900 [Terracidiphilus sp.]|jgi:hypothetical protein|nr:hypothetical protein [Terracidiphilus sp.]